MRHAMRSISVVVVSMLGVVCLAIASAFTAAFAFGATALIVPGTGTHNIDSIPIYQENALNRYITPADPNCDSACGLKGVDYPASFFPLGFLPGWCPGYSCDTWNESVSTGVGNLDAMLKAQLAVVPPEGDDGKVVIFGYSQGGAVVSREMQNILNDPTIDRSRISVVTIGNINNPLGLWSRLSFLPTIPFLDVSFGPQLPTSGITSTNYSFEYDPVGDAPQYWGNPLTMLNALAAFQYVHGYYLVPNENDPLPDGVLPYGYTDQSLADAIKAAPHRTSPSGEATFVLIPQKGPLPIFQPFIDLGKSTGTSGLIDPLVALLNPVTKLLVDLGYDRVSDPSVPRNLSILPFNPLTFNPIDFAVKFVAAIFQGIHDAINVILNPATKTVAPQNSSTLVSRTMLQQNTAKDTDLDGTTDLTGQTGVDGQTGLDGRTNLDALDKGAGGVNALVQSVDGQGTVDQDAVDLAAAQKAADEKAAAEKAAADEAAAKIAADKLAADQAAADKLAAEKAAEKQAAADAEAAEKAKAAAEKEAAGKAKEASEKEAAAAKAKEAADKAKGAREAAAKKAADKAKKAADKAKKAADKAKDTAADNGAGGGNGSHADESEPADNDGGTGESENKAA